MVGGAGRETPGVQTRPGIGGQGLGLVGRAGRRASPSSEAGDWWAGRRGRDRARGAEPAQRPLRGEGFSWAESGGSGWARAEQGRVSLGEWPESRASAWSRASACGSWATAWPTAWEGRVSPLKEGLPEGPAAVCGRREGRAEGRPPLAPGSACWKLKAFLV